MTLLHPGVEPADKQLPLFPLCALPRQQHIVVPGIEPQRRSEQRVSVVGPGVDQHFGAVPVEKTTKKIFFL